MVERGGRETLLHQRRQRIRGESFPWGITGYYIELELDEGEVWFGEMECPEYASVTNTFSDTSFFTDSFMLIFYRSLQILGGARLEKTTSFFLKRVLCLQIGLEPLVNVAFFLSLMRETRVEKISFE